MTRYVYLAGPIAGCSYKEATNWREAVVEGFAPGIVGISPMRVKEWCKQFRVIRGVKQYEKIDEHDFLVSGETHAIATRDFFDVSHADMVLAYLPKKLNERGPSWGTSIEIGWATALRVPVVVVSTDKALIEHPLVRGHVGWIVPDLGMAVAVVNSVLGAYVPGENKE